MARILPVDLDSPVEIRDIVTIARLEGREIPDVVGCNRLQGQALLGNQAATAFTTWSSASLSSYTVPLGKIAVLTEAKIDSDTAAHCAWLVRPSAASFPGITPSNDAYDKRVCGLVTPDTPLDLCKGGPRLVNEMETVTAFMNPPSLTSVKRNVVISGYELWADLNFGAKHRVLVIGDSTAADVQGDYTASAVKPTGRHLWKFRLINALRLSGASVRLVSHSIGGLKASEVAQRCLAGEYDGIDPSVLIVHLGLNDPGSTQAEADVFQANIQTICDWARRRNPGVHILINDMPPSDSSEKIVKRTRMRAAVDEVALAITNAGGRCRVATISDAYSNTSAVDFSNLEGAGAKIHPNPFGHSKLFGRMRDAVNGWASLLSALGSSAIPTNIDPV